MPFVSQKGVRSGGRQKGTVNVATANARKAIASLVDNNVPRMQAWLDEIAKKQGAAAAWRCMMDVIEYHVPKLQRTEMTVTGTVGIRPAAELTDDELAGYIEDQSGAIAPPAD